MIIDRFLSLVLSNIYAEVTYPLINETHILQIELKLLLVGFKLAGQLVALMVEGEQTLQEGQQLESSREERKIVRQDGGKRDRLSSI